jgi:glycosyltransferase involved in cell wall biosynthesis
MPKIANNCKTVHIKILNFVRTLRRMRECNVFFAYNLNMLSIVLLYNLFFRRKPVVYSFMGVDITVRKKLGLGFRRHKIKDWIFRLMMKGVNYYVCMSPYIYDVARSIGLPENRLFVIPNAFDTKKQFRIPSKPEIKKVIKKYNLKTGIPTVISVSNHTIKKNVKLIMKSVMLLSKKNKKIQVWLCGYGPLTQELKKLAEKSPENIKFYFVGRVQRDELRVFYYLSDVYVHLSHSDSGCNPVVESIASGGTPVVLSKYVGNGYFMKGKKFCKIVNLNSREAAAAINHYLKLGKSEQKKSRREAMIFAGKFDFKKVIPMWIKIFEKAVFNKN